MPVRKPAEGAAARPSGTWQDDLPRNRVGCVHALTALTPLTWHRAAFLALAFAKTKLFPGSEVTGLRDLAFVHFARWTFIRPPREARKGFWDRYLLFESNFNGSFPEYLDAFATHLREPMSRIWEGSYAGCTMESTTRFRRYARSHERGAEHYHCPYAKATVKEIEAALWLHERVERLVGRATAARDGPAGSFDAGELQEGIDELLTALGRPEVPPEEASTGLAALPSRLAGGLRTLLRPAHAEGPAGGDGVSGVTVLAPIAAGHVEELRRDIEQLRGDADGDEPNTPIGLRGRTHFARWVVVDELLHEGLSAEPVRLKRPMLLFSAAVEGAPDDYLGDLYAKIPERERRIWNHCEGLAGSRPPSEREAAGLFRRRRVRGGLFYPAYTATVEDVQRALDTRRRLRRFAIETQGAAGVDRGPEFLARFGSGTLASRPRDAPARRPPAAMRPSVRDSLWEIQGNVLRGYKRLPFGELLLVRIGDRRAGRAWLGELVPEVVTEGTERPEEVAVNIAVSYAGLRVLGLPDNLLSVFPVDFRQGMEERAKRLGDVGGDAPAHWELGLRAEDEGHILVILRAVCAAVRDTATTRLRRAIDAHAGLRIVASEPGGPIGDGDAGGPFAREHFGFADGISQPAVEGTLTPDDAGPRPATPWAGVPVDGGRWRGLKTGEFLLGYEDEDGVPAAPAQKFHVNGSFMVFRKLRQNVAAFERVVTDNAQAIGSPAGSPSPPDQLAQAREQMAAKIIGRWRSGAPLAVFPDAPPSRSERGFNDFGYGSDPSGFACPLGAHVRRSNPRDALVGGLDRTRRHRIIRRGMPYSPPPAGSPADRDSRGLLFICFNASIARQFEVVQGWCLEGSLFGVPDEADFIIGPTEAPPATMTVQGDRPRYLVREQALVETKGGGYFFYPSVPALEALASGEFEGLDEPVSA